MKRNSTNVDTAVKSFFAVSRKEHFDIEDMNQRKLFPQAFKKLRHLKPNEVYAFAPALVAGGLPKLENIEKEDLFIHLSILRELAPTGVPYQNVNFDRLIGGGVVAAGRNACLIV